MKDDDVTVDWPRVTTEQEYMDIGNELVPGKHPWGARMALWRSLRDRFAR